MSASSSKESSTQAAPVAIPVPSANELMASSQPLTLDQRIDRAFAAQQRARWARATSTAAERRERLRRLIDWTERHVDDIRQAGADDFGKPAIEVDLTEIWPVLSEAKFAIRHLSRWMRSTSVSAPLALGTTSSRVRYEARGVTLIISPWNYPFNLTLCPLVSALAAGSTAILKPSEMTPHTSALLAQMVEETFAEHEVALFEGEVEVSKALLAKPFDHIFFTGSPQVGKEIMKAAAEHLSTVTLELGGKSPVVIDGSAHLEDAAAKVAWGKFVNAGQTCIAPDYVLVEETCHDEFVAQLSNTIRTFYGEGTEDRQSSPDYARIVNQKHFERLSKMLDQSVDMGARVAFGGATRDSDHYVEPTLLTDVDLESPAMQEEIFGPLLPILPYRRLDDALELIQSKPKPLAMYLFSDHAATIDQLLTHTSAGGTCVNEVALHFLHPGLPFGGINNSGHGNSHGEYGFQAFSHLRPILKHHRFSALKLMAPPYGKLAKRLAALTLKYL